jgi:uncharacterized protein YkwD
MKIFYQFLICIFIILCFFVAKDDLLSIVKNNINLNNTNNKNTIIIDEGIKKNQILEGKVDTPGALKQLSENILNKNANISLLSDKIILFTNIEREKEGLEKLKENKKLDFSAEKKLQDMLDNQYFEHISPTGIGVTDLSKTVNYEYILIGENLAMGNFKNEEELVSAWMKSKGHKENILNKNYTEIGVSIRKGKFDGKDTWMAVQHFGTPTSVCPEVDKLLYGKIAINQEQINQMQNDLNVRRNMITQKVIYEGDTHSEQIEKYNILVNVYNNLIKETEVQIFQYNNIVESFNTCLLGFTNG